MLEVAKIKELDAKILGFLLENSRTGFTEIAKACKVSTGTIRNRYDLLRETGIINGEIMQVNPYNLGYRCICDIGIATSIKNEKEIRDHLNAKSSMNVATGPWGRFSVKYLVALRENKDLQHTLEELESDFRIKTVETLIWAETSYLDHPENLLIKTNQNDFRPEFIQKDTQFKVKKIQINQTDINIAKILALNSRTSFREVGKQVGLSTKSVIQRYKKLRKTILTNSTVSIDLRKLGYNGTMHTLIKAQSKNKNTEIQAQLIKIPNLIVVLKLIGQYDFLTISPIADLKEFFSLRNQIRSIEGIEKEETFVWEMFPTWPINIFYRLLESNKYNNFRKIK